MESPLPSISAPRYITTYSHFLVSLEPYFFIRRHFDPLFPHKVIQHLRFSQRFADNRYTCSNAVNTPTRKIPQTSPHIYIYTHDTHPHPAVFHPPIQQHSRTQKYTLSRLVTLPNLEGKTPSLDTHFSITSKTLKPLHGNQLVPSFFLFRNEVFKPVAEG